MSVLSFQILITTLSLRGPLFDGFIRPHISMYGGSMHFIEDSFHRGASYARNQLLRDAIADYIMFHDDDTMHHIDCPRAMANALDHNPEASFAYADFVGIVTEPEAHGGRVNFFQLTPPIMNRTEIHKRNIIDTHSMMRREAVMRVGGWDESLAYRQDWDLYKRLADASETDMVGVKAECEPYIKFYTDKGISSIQREVR